MSRSKYSSERRQILNEGQSTMNKFRAMRDGDYKINTGKDAALYMASYIDNFKKGKLGDLQKRRVDPAKKREEKNAKQEGVKEDRNAANIKSPIVHIKANDTGKQVNDLYVPSASHPNYQTDIAQLSHSMRGTYENH